MSECRQELIAQGKPYPRSGCAKCGKWSPKSKECDAKSEADYTGEDLTPSEEAELGVTRTADGVSVGGFTFGAKTRITRWPMCDCAELCTCRVIT